MTLNPLSDKSLADRVADQIRDAIHDGHYQPGTRLVERTLAHTLGVSHIPIREALSRLAEEGLVERLPRRGSRVATLTVRELEELSSLRIVLEQFVVRRVQQQLTPDTVKELRTTTAAMRAAAARGNFRRVYDLDQHFHEQLWTVADHRLLSEVATQMRARVAGFLRAATAALEPQMLESHAAAHDVLLDAIASGDPERGCAEMIRHIEVAAERLRKSLPIDGDDHA